MMRIVGVHGIGNFSYYREHGSPEHAADAISRDWTTWLSGACGSIASSVSVCYYAHLLHRGTSQAPDDVLLLQKEERELFVAVVDLLRGAQSVPQGRATVPIRQAAEWLTEHYGATARRLVTMFVREATAYLSDPASPRRTRSREVIGERIRQKRPHVLIAHSLGSVIAYEALWAEPDLNVDLLITLGSPLGMNQVIFDRLLPEPMNGRGSRPPGVGRWVNFADAGDIIAIPSDLSSRFTGLEQHLPHSIATLDFHRVRSYLTCSVVTALLFQQDSVVQRES